MGTTLVGGHDQTLHLDVIRIPVFQPFAWLRAGWLDMRRPASIAYGALIVAVGWTILVFCGTHPYLIAAANSDDSLDGFKRNAPALFEFGVILAICAAVWFGISALVLGTVFHIGAPDMSETLYRGFLDSTNRSQVLAFIAIGGVLATWVFAVSVVSIPLIIDQHASAGQALRASVNAVLHNIPAMIVWSALILVLTIIGYATLLLGLLYIAPLLGHATWHAYKSMIR